MNSLSRKLFQNRGFLSALLLVALLSQSAIAFVLPQTGNGAATAPAAALTSAERKASAQVKLETIRDVTAKLSSNEFEGRGTAQPGADKAAAYLAERFAKLGLKPAGDNGAYLQQIKFKSTEVLPASSVKVGEAVLNHAEDYVVLPPYSADVDSTAGIVFAGFGVVSPELKRDDLAGLDLKGKIVIITNGQPAGVDTALWKRATTPQARTFPIFTRGAAALIIANAGSAQQPFTTIANYLSRRRVSLASAPVPPFKIPPMLIVSNQGMEKIFAGSPMTFAQTLEKALTGETVSRDLGKTATLALRFKIVEATSSNVVGVFEGSDPKLKEEAVVYTAHYDAYGVDGAGKIYPGAADNALGTATITGIAEAFTKAFPKPASRPRRSILFLAVTGEEYGLLGAEHWVQNPTWPLDKIAADINYDGIGTEVYGPVKRVVGFGAEHSDLGKVFEEVSAATGVIVSPDPMPEENAFVRSDHYAFVKQGVPSLMLLGGPEGDPSTWIARARKWLDSDYHSPNDTIKPDWNWTGPQTVAQVGMVIGLRVANADAMPAWNPTSQFNKPRKAKSAVAP